MCNVLLIIIYVLYYFVSERQYNFEQELRKHVTNKRFLINTLEKLHGRQGIHGIAM